MGVGLGPGTGKCFTWSATFILNRASALGDCKRVELNDLAFCQQRVKLRAGNIKPINWKWIIYGFGEDEPLSCHIGPGIKTILNQGEPGIPGFRHLVVKHHGTLWNIIKKRCKCLLEQRQPVFYAHIGPPG